MCINNDIKLKKKILVIVENFNNIEAVDIERFEANVQIVVDNFKKSGFNENSHFINCKG
jgi:hypothetical protein